MLQINCYSETKQQTTPVAECIIWNIHYCKVQIERRFHRFFWGSILWHPPKLPGLLGFLRLGLSTGRAKGAFWRDSQVGWQSFSGAWC